tara:strand:+ start:516 stop:944 length:429 start_codon:yes stop_codon:yes gene_type:complete
MKAGHYLKWAEKAFPILNKFHSRMFELGGEESDLWNDDLNCRFYDLERSLDDDNYDGWGYDRNGYFYQLQKTDERIEGCDDQVNYYLDEIKNLKDKIKRTKEKKIELQKCREKMIVDFDMDYKTIEKRLSQEYPEFIATEVK